MSKVHHLPLLIILIIIVNILIISCEEKPNPPQVKTTAVSDISYTSASSGGEVTDDGGSSLTARGICWNTTLEPTVYNFKTAETGGTGSFESEMTQLLPNTKYYVRAYATNAAGTSYGNQVSLTTFAVVPASLTTTDVTSITQTSAVSGGNITSENGSTITERGVCWSISQNPSILHDKTSDGKGSGLFTSNLTGLKGNTTYYLRAYATNSAGTEYGAQVNFKTSPAPPVLSTSAITSIERTSAITGGTITSDGGASIKVQGVCWSTSSGPTVDLVTKTTDDLTSKTFSSLVMGLTVGTKYYIRAYATNSAGTGYGDELNFTTSTAKVPAVITSAASNITGTTATAGGDVTDDGGAGITVRGIVWNTSENPTVGLTTKTSETGTTGSFASSMTNLTLGTKYYVRAYATNSSGTTYGTQISFTTLNVPTITTISAMVITLVSAKSGGNVTSDGGSTITARGVVWSTKPSPTIYLTTKTTETGTSGIFNSSLTGLNSNTTYYLKAYATNSIGTSYGSEVSFKTQTEGTVTDIEGNVYKTITISDQTWMTENLKVTKFNDGTTIPNVTDGNLWYSTTAPAYCLYNDDVIHKDIFGALYNWNTVNPGNNGSKNVCPVGWHVPSDGEWTNMELYLTNSGFGYGGSGKDIAKALAEKAGWNNSDYVGSPGNNQSLNNLSGFSALAAGGRMGNNNGNIYSLGVGVDADWWCAPVNNERTNWARQVSWFTGDFIRSYQYKYSGLSIRCVKDK